MFVAEKGATLLYRDPYQTHLHVICTDPYGPKDQVLLVPVCTVKPGTNKRDKVCILNVGDHPFINRESFVAYAICRVEEAGKIVACVNSGYFVDKGAIDSDVFDRILAGFECSKRLAPYFKSFLETANQASC